MLWPISPARGCCLATWQDVPPCQPQKENVWQAEPYRPCAPEIPTGLPGGFVIGFSLPPTLSQSGPQGFGAPGVLGRGCVRLGTPLACFLALGSQADVECWRMGHTEEWAGWSPRSGLGSPRL